ncbi:toll/interleukin-1 receptor domain-containing protein [Variovorax robiniae]|uniref:Toll/interleukin-1 receptor domain-containing protein n=1 Tax=Variovorax robiniae TaxID=1836199 RepID=A0ABU8XJK6_9BURK
MQALFISYRRQDSEAYAGRLADDLIKAFPETSVFLDIEGIPLGEDFRDVISSKVAECDVLLAVIGKLWLDCVDANGDKRLFHQDDLVRIEICAALDRKIPVIPVLVAGASMPLPDQLPPSITPLAFRNGFEISTPRWRSDVASLVARLQKEDGVASSRLSWPLWFSSRTRASLAVAAAALIVASLAFVSWQPEAGNDQPSKGSVGWIYVGMQQNGAWNRNQADCRQPLRTLRVSSLPQRGKAYRMVWPTNLRDTSPEQARPRARPTMTPATTVLYPGRLVAVDDVREFEVTYPDGEWIWIWAHVTVKDLPVTDESLLEKWIGRSLFSSKENDGPPLSPNEGPSC